MHLRFSEIAAGTPRLRTADAVALVLAAAREVDRRGTAGEPAGLPDAEHILLSAGGRVWFSEPGCTVGERQRVSGLAVLLQDLLALDRRPGGETRSHAPGALLVLIARALGHIDLPQPSFAAFQEGLARFGSADRVTLAALHRRMVGRAGSLESTSATAATPATVTRSTAPADDVAERPERRRRGPRASDLRRELRATGLQRFASTPIRQRPRTLRVRAAAAALVLAVAGGAFALLLKEKSATEPADVRVITSFVQPKPAPASPAFESPGRDTPPAPGPRPGQTLTSSPRARQSVPPPGQPARRAAPPAQAIPILQQISVGPMLSAAMIGADLFSPSFSAEGELLFHAGRDRAALMRAAFDDQGRPVTATLLADGEANYHAALSPDGEWLAFDSDRDGTRGVYVGRADASDARKISGDGYAAVPRWAPDGRRLAFIRAEPDRPRVWNVWVADLTAGTLSRVSRHRVGQAWGASWFPDGRRLAYSVEDTLVIARIDGSTVHVLRSPRPGRLVRTPAVSPDGSWILFQVYRDGVWLLEVSSGRMHRVLADRAAEEFAWAPDSRRVVYHTRREGAYSLWQLEFGD